MNEWADLTIGNLCDTISCTFQGNDPTVVLVNTSDVLDGSILNHTRVPNANLKGQFKKTFQKDDILYSEIRPANKRYAFVDFDDTSIYIASTKLMVIRPKTDVVHPRFLYALLTSKTMLEEMQHLAETRSGTFPQITFSTEVAPTPVRVPNINTQIKIVALLDALSSKIENNTHINDNLQQQARTLLAQWMIENEGNYEVCPLSDVAETNPETYSPKDAWKYVNYLDTSSITDGIISEVQRIDPSAEKLPSRARRIISENDVVFSTVRPNQRHFGIISDPLSNMLASTGFAVVRSKHPYVSNELLYLCLTEKRFVDKMQQLAEQSTSTFPSIKPSDLGACEIPCPIDQRLSDALKAMFVCISSNQRENVSLTALRDTLLPKLMSGEIDLSEVSI